MCRGASSCSFENQADSMVVEIYKNQMLNLQTESNNQVIDFQNPVNKVIFYAVVLGTSLLS